MGRTRQKGRSSGAQEHPARSAKDLNASDINSGARRLEMAGMTGSHNGLQKRYGWLVKAGMRVFLGIASMLRHPVAIVYNEILYNREKIRCEPVKVHSL